MQKRKDREIVTLARRWLAHLSKKDSMSRWKEALGFTKNYDTQNSKINHQNDLHQSKDLMHNVIDDDIVLLQTAASKNPIPIRNFVLLAIRFRLFCLLLFNLVSM